MVKNPSARPVGSTEARPAEPLQRVRLRGEIDLAVHDQTLDLLVDAAGTGGVLVDLSAVTFIDSSGLRALIAASNKVPVSLTRVPEPIEQVLRIAGLDGYFGRR